VGVIGHGRVCCEHGDELSGSVQSGEFLDQLRDCAGQNVDVIRAGLCRGGCVVIPRLEIFK